MLMAIRMMPISNKSAFYKVTLRRSLLMSPKRIEVKDASKMYLMGKIHSIHSNSFELHTGISQRMYIHFVSKFTESLKSYKKMNLLNFRAKNDGKIFSNTVRYSSVSL